MSKLLAVNLKVIILKQQSQQNNNGTIWMAKFFKICHSNLMICSDCTFYYYVASIAES